MIYGTPTMVTNNLVLHLDFVNTKSYSGSGSIVTDMSGSQNNGTLINSPAFSNEFGGGLIFNGSNNWINMGTNSSHVFSGSYTISIWIKNTTTTSTNEFVVLNGFGTLNGSQLNYALRKLSNVYIWYLSDGSNIYTLSSNTTINTNITNIVLSMDANGSTTIYINGSTDKTITSYYSTYSGVRNELAISGLANGGGTNFLTGNIYQLSMYNKGLSTLEVQQNFNAIRTRFNI
jgi:hypothetical protein